VHPSREHDPRLDDVRTEIEGLLDSREDWAPVAGGAERTRYDELCTVEKGLLAPGRVLPMSPLERKGVLLVAISEPRCRLETVNDGPVSTVSVRGKIDVASAADVRGWLDSLARKGQERIVVDLAELDFMDSTGLGALIGALKCSRMQGADLVLTNPSSAVMKLLKTPV
jgi:anti-sigma B factor antagonist